MSTAQRPWLREQVVMELGEALKLSAAFRARTRMQPAGGAGDKLFPPTYATGDSAVTKYALETRRVEGTAG